MGEDSSLRQRRTLSERMHSSPHSGRPSSPAYTPAATTTTTATPGSYCHYTPDAAAASRPLFQEGCNSGQYNSPQQAGLYARGQRSPCGVLETTTAAAAGLSYSPVRSSPYNHTWELTNGSPVAQVPTSSPHHFGAFAPNHPLSPASKATPAAVDQLAYVTSGAPQKSAMNQLLDKSMNNMHKV